MDLSGIAFAIAIVVGIILMIPLLIGGVFVIVVVANRADPDVTGRRPAVVYAFATAFLTLFVTLFATTGVIASLANLIGPHHLRGNGGLFGGPFGGGGNTLHPVGDAVARGVVLSLLVALIAGAAYWLHVTAAARGSEGAVAGEPVARVRSSFVSAVSFVAVFLVIGSAVVVVYDVFRLLGPGVFSPGQPEREIAFRSMLPAAWLGFWSLVLLLMHVQHLPHPIRLPWTDRVPPGPLGGRTSMAAQPDPPTAPPPPAL